MPVGAAIGIGAFSGGVSLFGAHEAANASKTAAQIQSTSADKALGVEQGIYNSQVQRTQPYVDAGKTALNNLMDSYYGTPFTSQVNNMKAAAGYPVAASPSPAPAPAAASPQMPTMPNAVPPGSPQPIGAPAGPSGGTVPMIAPTGETAMVPAAMVQAFQAKGARIANYGAPAAPSGTLGALAQPMRMAS